MSERKIKYTLIDADYAEGQAPEDATGHRGAMGWDPEEDNAYGAAEKPGMNHNEEYEVECIYDAEVVDGVDYYAVKWKNWPQEYNTLETFETIVDTSAYTHFLQSRGVEVSIGSMPKTTAKCSGRTASGFRVEKHNFIGIEIPRDVTPLESPRYAYEAAVYDVPRPDVLNGKFNCELGYYSNNGDYDEVKRCEFDCIRKIKKAWDQLSSERFIFFEKIIGNIFPGNKELNEFEERNPEYKNLISTKKIPIICAFSEILNKTSKCIVALLARPEDLKNQENVNDIHLNVLIVFGLKKARKFYLFEPYSKRHHPHVLVSAVKNDMAKNFIIQQAFGTLTGGRACLKLGLEFAALVMHDIDWQSRYEWSDTWSTR